MPIGDKQVLIIDDDEDILALVKRVIDGIGAECEIANSVKSGVAKALTKRPGLIITDLSMPLIDGFKFLEKKKTIAQLKDIPVLVFTASSKKADLNRAMALGATDYLNKPLKAALLIQKVRKCLQIGEEAGSGVRFPQKPKVTIKLEGDLLGINDSFINVGSIAAVDAGRTIRIESPLFDECGIKNSVFKIDRRSTVSGVEGKYLTKAKIIGLSEELRKVLGLKIRYWK